MKLLYVSNHRFIKNNAGEIFTTGQMGEKYFERFKEYFDSITIIGLCEQENRNNTLKKIEKININADKLSYIFINANGSNLGRLKAIYRIRKKYLEIIHNYDRISTKSPSMIALAAVNNANKVDKPVLVEMVGCPWDAYWNHSFKGKIIAPIMWLLTKLTIKRATYTVYVTNEFLQRRYPTKGLNIGCSDVALPSLDEKVIDKRVQKILNMKTNDPIKIGTTAAVNVRYKGQEFVIEAISRLNKEGFNFEYHLAGGGDNSYLKSVAKKFNVEDKIIFLGSLPHTKVFDYLDSMDIYIQPSKQEGLPRALVEAMSRGCPSLGSTTGGIPELLNKEFIFKNGSVDEICTILKQMDSNILLDEANRSFSKAKEYDKTILDSRRASFYKNFQKALVCNK